MARPPRGDDPRARHSPPGNWGSRWCPGISQKLGCRCIQVGVEIAALDVEAAFSHPFQGDAGVFTRTPAVELRPQGPIRTALVPASPWRTYTLQEAAAFAAAAGKGTVLLAAVSGPYLPFLSSSPTGSSASAAPAAGTRCSSSPRITRHPTASTPSGQATPSSCPPRPTLRPPTSLGPRGSSTSPRAVRGICYRFLSLGETTRPFTISHELPWSKQRKSNDQPAFNWALNKTAEQVDVYLLPGCLSLHFQPEAYISRIKHGSRTRRASMSSYIIINNYITGFEKKIKRFRDHGLWLVDDHSHESPLGRI
ncbi:uncharacterized protein LOC120656364 [Panicum virgatum]|uniref:uncharacterized protein LOC120656364 n=1 Tax=Panicum virgatum TaxID=38727 RepID=UPI0019D63B39|nr:uncharacterized protein LOC120656364 [Panicum virgatum]